MTVHNSEISAAFRDLADLLEIEGANRFRVRAYRNAAATIDDQTRSLAAMMDAGEDLSALPGIGTDLAGRIAGMIETGTLDLLEETRAEVPEAATALTAIAGIGPKRARALVDALEIETADAMRAAAEAGQVAEVPGFGPKLQDLIARGLAEGVGQDARMRIDRAEDFAEPLIAFIRGLDGVKRAEVAGSYRRRKESVGDLDILIAARRDAGAIAAVLDYDEIETVALAGKKRATARLRAGLQVDFRVVPEASFGAALIYFTGSKAHNLALRRRALERGLKLNEYGLFKGRRKRAGAAEDGVYKALGLPAILPELRENRGEIAAAEAGDLPEPVSAGDIHGDLHTHSEASDGKATLAELADGAMARGYGYLAVTDHSVSQRQAGGLDAGRLAAQIDEIAALNEGFDGFRLLSGVEVDILEDGALDLPDDLLARLDVVVASVHSRFGLSEEAQTTRILRALDNPNVAILGHPTGRLIGQRPPYPVNVEAVLEAAKERGCHVELNAHPARLDLSDTHCHAAREIGVKVAISTDAHSVAGLDAMRFGIGQARRGWLEPADVLNARDWPALKALLKRG